MISAARFTALTIREYVAQRHMLPVMPSTICCSLGCGFFAKCCGLHDLPRLTVAALRHLMLDPRFLHRMSVRRIEAFDGGDQLAFDGPDSDRAGAHGLSVNVHRAAAAQANAAAIFGAGESEVLTDDPQQRSVRGRLGEITLTIDRQVRHGSFPPSSRMGWTPVEAA